MSIDAHGTVHSQGSVIPLEDGTHAARCATCKQLVAFATRDEARDAVIAHLRAGGAS